MQERDQIRRALYELHRLTGVPPSVKILDGEVEKVGELAVAGGVALKALRYIKASDQKAKRRFEAEIQVWDKLDHPHILAFYGIVTNLGQIHMVSPWQDYGNVLEYVQAYSDANRIHLVGGVFGASVLQERSDAVPQLTGAAGGVQYLHEHNIVHGNLKCTNILVNDDHEARICDFGMSTVIEELGETSASSTSSVEISARWLAPELLEGTDGSPTVPADIYSFAMAILELFTEQHPFSDVKLEAAVIHRVVVLKRPPSRPTMPKVWKWLTDELWGLMLTCWSSDANKRPLMRFVAARIKNIEDSIRTCSPDLIPGTNDLSINERHSSASPPMGSNCCLFPAEPESKDEQIVAALVQFETNISPWASPFAWIEANNLHIISILQRAEHMIGSYGFLDAHLGPHMIYPLKTSPTRSTELENTLRVWRAWNDITFLEKHQEVAKFLQTMFFDHPTKASALLSITKETFDALRSLDVMALSVQLTVVLMDPIGYERLLERREQSAQSLLDILQARLDYPIEPQFKRRHLHALVKLSELSLRYPECLALKDVTLPDYHIVGGGSFGEVYRGKMAGNDIAVKVLKVYQKSDKDSILKVRL
ncbi:hypothetical protein HWV62_13455 [Athelia sp. TMB]|nr:hypothetical protein HWV62_13455 [Athelia sp. TMB]